MTRGSKMVKLNTKSSRPYIAYAINSSEDDYRLAWLINRSLGITLTRAEYLAPQEDLSFPVFSFIDDTAKLIYTLAANRVTGDYLLPQLKNIDYILKISGSLTKNHQLDAISKLRSISEVVACISIKTATPTVLTFLQGL